MKEDNESGGGNPEVGLLIARLPTEIAASLGHVEVFEFMYRSGLPVGNALRCTLFYVEVLEFGGLEQNRETGDSPGFKWSGICRRIATSTGKQLVCFMGQCGAVTPTLFASA